MRILALAALTILPAVHAVAAAQQPDITWPDGAKAAISLTYDDSLDSHLDNALPALDRRGFKATFYLTVERPGFLERTEEWGAAAANGHELGNHTLFHPCRGSLPDRDWVQPEADLDNYTVARMVREAQLTNALLKTVDGRESRSYAYPCGESAAGGESYVDAIRPFFPAGRGVIDRPADAAFDMMQLPTFGLADVSGETLIAYAEDVLEKGEYGSFTFHGIGAEYLAVSTEAHEALLDWLDAHRDEIWVAPVDRVAQHMNASMDAAETR